MFDTILFQVQLEGKLKQDKITRHNLLLVWPLGWCCFHIQTGLTIQCITEFSLDRIVQEKLKRAAQGLEPNGK